MIRTLVLACLWVVALHSEAGEITSHTFPVDRLESDYRYQVYLPDGYDADSERTYPVVYLLHGSFSDAGFWSINLDVGKAFDRMIEAGQLPPLIAVMPEANSWWIDGRNEPAETAFFKDLLPHIEQRFHARQDRAGRLVAGVSAGGYATVNFSLKYPTLFAAGAALSPASYEDLPPEGSTAYLHPAYVDDDENFDAALWRAQNYPAFLPAYLEQDTIVPLYINSGDHDALDIAYHAAVLYQKLRQHQPDAVEFRVVDGDHELSVWQRTFDEAMQYIFGFVGSN
ncbi:MAG: alpha/beta hydrolase-fold protein [Pseudomonadota bacterium]